MKINMNMNKDSIVIGIAAAASATLTGIAGYQVGMRRTRKLYEAQINVLTALRMNEASSSMVSEAMTATTAVEAASVEAPVEVVPEIVLATDNGSQTPTDVSVLPKINAADIQTSRRKVVAEISDDITSAVYTSHGITIEEAEMLLNGELTIDDYGAFPVPEGGLWVAGRIIGGDNEENREIHKKAVEAALLAKAQVETPKRKKTTSKEKRMKDMAAAAAAKNPLGQPEDSI